MAEVMGMITGKTKNLGVMGWPIAHSLSPGMQQAAIAAAGADYFQRHESRRDQVDYCEGSNK